MKSVCKLGNEYVLAKWICKWGWQLAKWICKWGWQWTKLICIGEMNVDNKRKEYVYDDFEENVSCVRTQLWYYLDEMFHDLSL